MEKGKLLWKNGFFQQPASSFGIIKSLLEFGNSFSIPLIHTISSSIRFLGGIIKKTKSKTIDLSSKVLCFDDLERFDTKNLSLNNILGYINTNYLEHNHIKILFICNEAELDKYSEYKQIKEKVIGRVVNFQQDLELSISNLIRNRYTLKKDSIQFLEKNRELILSIIRNNKVDNFRTIGFALDSLEPIFRFCDSHVTKAHLERLIIFIMLISFEYKAARLTPSDYNDIKDLDEIETRYQIWYGLKKQSSVEPPPYNILFYERYLKARNIDFTFYKSVYVYLLTGYIIKAEIEADIRAIDSKGVTAWDSAYSKFLDFKKLEQNELYEIILVVLDFAQAGKYKPKEYLSIYSYLKNISEREYLQKSFEGYFEQLRSGLNCALTNLPEKTIKSNAVWMRHELKEREDSQYNQLVNMIKDHLDHLNKYHIENQIHEFISSLNDDALAFGYLDKIGIRHLFSRLNTHENINQLLTLTNQGIYNLEAILYLNYLRVSNAGDSYFDDVPHIKIISEQIEKMLPSKGFDKMRVARFIELITSMRKSAMHLEKTKKAEN